MATTPFNAALNAYGSASRLISQATKPQVNQTADIGQGDEFAKFLAQSVQSAVDQGKQSDQMALDLVNGKANVVDVVTSIAQTEFAIESMVTVRDRVISAYEEIMRMPI